MTDDPGAAAGNGRSRPERASPPAIRPISLVVCTRDRPGRLRRLLESLCRMRVPPELDWQLLVVDNGSEGGVAEAVERYRGRLPLRSIREPRAGLSHARNAAIPACAGSHIVWTDDDVTVSRDWLLVYERAFRYWPQAGFFGGPVLARCEGETPDWFPAALDEFPETFAHIDPGPEFVALEGGLLPFGANMGFRAGMLDRLRFNPRLGRKPGPLLTGGEENRVFRELRAAGVEGMWLPPARVCLWIDPPRATPRYLYDFFLGEAFAEECPASADSFPEVSPGMLDAAFDSIDHAVPADGGASQAWLGSLRSAAVADGRRLAWSLVPGHFRAGRRHGPRVLALCLDGFSEEVAETLIVQGDMPNLTALRGDAARFTLDHGDALYSGLAWEHFSSGREPAAGGRYSAVDFDPLRYRATQRPTRMEPFVAGLERHAVVFDVPYLDLERTPRGSGLTHWGAHDPGVPQQACPESLAVEVRRRFGSYPADRWIYGFTWPDVQATGELSRALVRGLEQRAEIGRWLLGERFPNWDLALVATGELHSGIEPLWHGFDRSHPLHAAASAAPSWQGLIDIYRALDRLIGTMAEIAGDDSLVVFSMHGMCANSADLPAMLLLPELLYRREFARHGWSADPGWAGRRAEEMLGPGADWSREVNRRLCLDAGPQPADEQDRRNLSWMPAERYRDAWPLMRAFALPSFYDGRIRINLKEREARGLVEPGEWSSAVDELIEIVEACRDPVSGGRVVESVHVYPGDPLRLDPSDADVVVRWKPTSALQHPDLGTIGPAPIRRPGGHGGPGVAWIRGPGVTHGDRGGASAFDVAPTVVELLGCPVQPGMSGRSLVPRAVQCPG